MIKDHGIDYEKGKFQDKLNDGTLTCQRTNTWLRKAIIIVHKTGEIKLDALIAGDSKAYIDLHIAAILQLVTDKTPVRMDTVPETLILDARHIDAMYVLFNHITNISVALVMVKQAIQSSKRDSDARKWEEKCKAVEEFGTFLVQCGTFDPEDTVDHLKSIIMPIDLDECIR